MDITLSNIVRSAGFKFRLTYDTPDENFDPVVYKFVADGDADYTDQERKNIVATVKSALDAASFKYIGVAFERGQRAKGDDYWAVVIRVPGRIFDRLLDRDIHGNLIYRNTKTRAA
jgi:hypothetical protein